MAGHPDSVHVLHSLVDTLTASRPSAHGLPDSTLRVVVERPPARDWFDWLQLLASIVVAPLAAIWAARIGGRMAYDAAMNAQREQASREHSDRSMDRVLASNKGAMVYRRRLALDAWAALHIIGRELARKNEGRAPISDLTTGQLMTLWRSYFRHRDEMIEHEKRDWQSLVAEFYENGNQLAIGIRAFERDEAARKARLDPSGIGGTYLPPVTQRAAYLKLLSDHNAKTKEMMQILGIRNVGGQGNDPPPPPEERGLPPS